MPGKARRRQIEKRTVNQFVRKQPVHDFQLFTASLTQFLVRSCQKLAPDDFHFEKLLHFKHGTGLLSLRQQPLLSQFLNIPTAGLALGGVGQRPFRLGGSAGLQSDDIG